MSLCVLLMRVAVHIPMANSLKEKRRVIQGVKERVRRKFNVSVAEVDFLSVWQRSELALTMVGNEPVVVQQTMAKIEEMLREMGDFFISDCRYEWL